jgi:hypothetical protein
VGLGHFEEWNFDGSWDSDPSDGRGPERAADHSGHALLRLVARYGAAYLCGHVHRDEQHTYRKGERILGDIVAEREVTFLRVTTTSASPSRGAYWGYRIVTALPDGRLSLAPFSGRLASVPAGNLWVTGEGRAAPGAAPFSTGVAVHSGLPEAVRVRVRAVLPAGGGPGYRFGARAPAGARLEDLFPLARTPGGPRRAIHYLRLALPAAGPEATRDPQQVQVTDVRADPASANRPPRPVVRAQGRLLSAGEPLSLEPGETPELDAAESRDPDGDTLLPPLWRLLDVAGQEVGGGRGPRHTLRARRPGPYRLELHLWDDRGAHSSSSLPVRVR